MINKYYEGTSKIIQLATEIGKNLGVINATNKRKLKTSLRKENKIKTIYSSLYIEGNTLSIEQITDVINNKRVGSATNVHLHICPIEPVALNCNDRKNT